MTTASSRTGSATSARRRPNSPQSWVALPITVAPRLDQEYCFDYVGQQLVSNYHDDTYCHALVLTECMPL